MPRVLTSIVLCIPGILCISDAAAQRARNYPPHLPDATEHVYKTIDDVDLKAWVFTPETDEADLQHPAVVFFFGGGWRAGTPMQFAEQCRYLKSRGVVAITCDYRVGSRQNVKAVSCVEDAKSAIRWVRKNAKRLRINPQQICAAGGSAGGHIACCTGVVPGFDSDETEVSVSSIPNAMALFNPAVMLAAPPGVTLPKKQQQKLADLPSRTGVDPIRISPVHHIAPNQPPTIIFHGKADTTVPYTTVEEFTRLSQKAGNDVTLVGYNQAPHGFFNNRGGTSARGDQSLQWYRSTVEQMDRFLVRLGWLHGEPTERFVSQHVRLRRYLDQSRFAFKNEKRGRVAFLGGSITEANGYRPRVQAWLQEQYPETKFDFINAGISSTCSHAGAFRMARDVLNKGRVDLLFVDFAVNDDQDAAHSGENCVRGIEGVIRSALASNPRMDIIMIHFPNDGMLETIAGGMEPLSSGEHERVARHYSVSSIYLSRYVAEAIADETLTWEQYGGTHPKGPGHELTAGLIARLLYAGSRTGAPARSAPEYKLPAPLNKSSFSSGRLIAAADADVDISDGWQRSVPDWEVLSGSKRARFSREVMLHSEQADSTLRFDFAGSAVGAWVLAGPDAGVIEYRIDGDDWQSMDLKHHYSSGLHYPRVVLFAAELKTGEHRLELRIQPSAKDRGSAVRILALAVNGEE